MNKKQVENEDRAFRECFSTPTGKVVLEALKADYYDCLMTSGPGLEFKAGSRFVIHDILDRINTNDD